MKLFRCLFGKLAKPSAPVEAPAPDPRDIAAEMIAMDILKELPEFHDINAAEMMFGSNRVLKLYEVRLKNLTFKVYPRDTYGPIRFEFHSGSMYDAVGFFFTSNGDKIVRAALDKCCEIQEKQRAAEAEARLQQKAIDFIEKRLKLDAKPEPRTGYEGMKMSELLALMKEKEHLSEEEQRQINAEILRLQKFVVTEKKFR